MARMIGDQIVTKRYLGDTPISRTYQGDNLVWEATPSEPTTLFAASSPINQPIGASPTLDAASTDIATAFGSGTKLVNIVDYGVPTAVATAATTRWSIVPTNSNEAGGDWGPNPLAGHQVPIDLNWYATPVTNDGVLVVYDGNLVYEFYEIDLSGAEPTCSWGSVIDITGENIDPGPTGAGVSRIAGVVRLSEWEAGVINHALVFSTDMAALTEFRAPATKTDGANLSGSPTTIEEGTRIQLDPTFDVDTIVEPYVKMIAVALQTYGAYCIDNGGARVGIVSEAPKTGDFNHPSLAGVGITKDYAGLSGVGRIDWSQIRVIADPADAPDPLAYAPAEDQPTIAVTALGAFTATSLASSDGFLREKRVGVAETAAGASQSSTADLDLTGSTRYAYPGLPSAPGFAANAGQYVSSAFKPGSDSTHQNAKWLFNFDTITSSPHVQFRINVVATSGQIGKLLVNGKQVQTEAFDLPATPAAGSGAAVTLTFPDARERRITFYGVNNNEGRWGGCAVDTGYTCTKPPAPTKKVAFLGDSYTNGHNEVDSVETWAWDVALHLGADAIMQAGIGGTGFVNTLTDMPTSHFQGRVADILAFDPDVLIIMGGRNDSTTGLQTAVENILRQLAENAGNSFISIPEVYVVSNATESGQATTKSTIVTATANIGRPFFDVPMDALPKIADGVHPTFEGHRTLAQNIIAEIDALLPAPTLTATPGDSQILLEWTAVPGATGYRVGHTEWETIDPSGTTSRNLTFLTNGTPVEMHVQAIPNGETAIITATPTA